MHFRSVVPATSGGVLPGTLSCTYKFSRCLRGGCSRHPAACEEVSLMLRDA